MSSTYSAVSADSHSALSELECEPSPSAKSSPIAEPSSRITGPTSPAMTMCEPLPLTDSGQMELFPMSSVAGSLARTFRRPANSVELKQSEVDYGPNTGASFASFDPITSLWRTSQICFSGELSAFSGTWPRSGMMLGGVACELVISEPPISEIGFGLLPTPRAAKRGARQPQTAIASLLRVGRTKAHKLEDALVILEGRTGIPNPAYVAWMMGFNPTWCRLAPTETPSSRKSRNSSVAPSCKRKD